MLPWPFSGIITHHGGVVNADASLSEEAECTDRLCWREVKFNSLSRDIAEFDNAESCVINFDNVNYLRYEIHNVNYLRYEIHNINNLRYEIHNVNYFFIT